MHMKLPLGHRYITFLRCIPTLLLLCNFLGVICISESFTYSFFCFCFIFLGPLCWILLDSQTLMDMLTYPEVEEAIRKRVEMKAKTYAQEVTMSVEGDEAEPVYKIEPSLVADLYGDWIMPLTKEVQVEYLLRRLD